LAVTRSESAKQVAMESAEKAAARKRMRLGRNGTILTKTMVLMVHMSTVYATVLPRISAFSLLAPSQRVNA
jgi:hypothetical protein